MISSNDLGFAWSAQLIRLSLFPHDPSSFSDLTLPKFLKIETELEEIREKQGFRREVGSFEDRTIELRLAPERADVLLYSKQVDGPNTPAPNLNLGSFDEYAVKFRDLVTEPLKTLANPILRIALGSVLLLPSANREDAYKNLSKCLKAVTVDPQNMRDLTYRINWRAKSDISGVEYINRITIWNAVSTRVIQVGSISPNPRALREEHYVNLELDINSPVEQSQPLSGETLSALFTKFIELALENSRLGEVRANG